MLVFAKRGDFSIIKAFQFKIKLVFYATSLTFAAFSLNYNVFVILSGARYS